jgi:hypothetical protein
LEGSIEGDNDEAVLAVTSAVVMTSSITNESMNECENVNFVG